VVAGVLIYYFVESSCRAKKSGIEVGVTRSAESCGQETAALGELVAVRLGNLLDDSVSAKEAKETAELG